MGGPLTGVRVIEMQGAGPGPFGVMIPADHGADVIRAARTEDASPASDESGMERMIRGQRAVLVDWGFSRAEADGLLAAGAVAQAAG